jgi:hypothetical protein
MEDDTGTAYGTYGEKKHTWFWLGNPKEREHVEDLDMAG